MKTNAFMNEAAKAAQAMKKNAQTKIDQKFLQRRFDIPPCYGLGSDAFFNEAGRKSALKRIGGNREK